MKSAARAARPSGGGYGVPLRRYLAGYALYAVVLVLCFAIFWVWRRALAAVTTLVFGTVAYAPTFYYLMGTVLVGLALFAVAVLAEGYLRTGARRRQLARRFVRLAVPMLVAMLVGLALQAVR